jgi:uncharacterized protein YjbI with pentapeptide repeats
MMPNKPPDTHAPLLAGLAIPSVSEKHMSKIHSTKEFLPQSSSDPLAALAFTGRVGVLQAIEISRTMGVPLSLRNAPLKGVDLHDIDLSGADLTGADLRFAFLIGARLANANLARADLSYAYLTDADLRGADLRRARLMEADLSGADIRGADLRFADLRRTTFDDSVYDRHTDYVDENSMPLSAMIFHGQRP